MSEHENNHSIDEMVAHLIDLCPELHGYSMDPEWCDKDGQQEVQPDRVLLHPDKPIVGMEFTELLPAKKDMTGSVIIRDDNIWKKIVYYTIYTLRERGETNLADHLLMRLTISDNLPPRIKEQNIAIELAQLIIDHKPTHDYLLGEVDKAMIKRYNKLESVLSEVIFAIDASEPGWHPDFQCIDPDWFNLAVHEAKSEKAKKVKEYKNQISNKYVGTPTLCLVLWCRNCTPIIPKIFFSDHVTEYNKLFDSSGFDSVWYISGIRDNETNKLGSSWQFYPVNIIENKYDWIYENL